MAPDEQAIEPGAAVTTQSCEMCDKPGTRRCSGCKHSKYCSEACQKEAWSKHRLICKSFQEYIEGNRPEPKGPGSIYRRAILFHPDEDRPRFVWLELKKEDAFGDGEIYEMPQLKEYGIDVGGVHYILENPRLDRELPHCIMARYRDNFFNDGSQANKAIYKSLNREMKDKTRDWRGPVVVYGLQEVDHQPVPSIDLDTSDFRHIVDWLNWKS